jgi:molecular chaperone DnaK
VVKQFFGKEPARNVNPDEVVAVGAAVQAAC